MTSAILQTAARLLHPVLLMFSIFLLLRGHHEPGGGFSGGLVAASAYVLHALAFGTLAARRALRFEPRTLIGAGLGCALAAGLPALFDARAFLTAGWVSVPLPGLGEWTLGTPLLFDVGVYFVVIGMTVLIVLSLSEQ